MSWLNPFATQCLQISPNLVHALLHDAMENMRNARQRTLLALTGIGIGAAAVVSLLSIGENTSEEAAKQFRSMGSDLVVVQDSPIIGGQRKHRKMGQADAHSLIGKIPSISQTAPLSSTSARAGAGKNAADVMVIGATEEFLSVGGFQLEKGRFVTRMDGHNTVVVVGKQLSMNLNRGTEIDLGDMVRIDKYLYTVVGILKQTPRNPLLPFDVNEALIIPIKADRRLAMSTGDLSNIVIRVGVGHDPTQVLDEITQYFQGLGAAVQIQGAQQLIEGMRQQGQLFKWLLGGIAFISLLVGGLGVMNVMLAGISERKNEIGLRLAIGANQTSIMTMITAESVWLTCVGGGVGTVLGILISVLFALLSGWEPVLSGFAILLGFGMSLASGLFFGIYPALKASALSPVEALRADI